MRILVALALLVSLVSAYPTLAIAESKGDTNQNAKEDNTKTAIQDKQISWEDNLVASAFIPTAKRKIAFAKKTKITYAVLPKGDFVINASAYTAAADECGKSDGITASGAKVQANRTLACPPGYKFGTKVEIDGMGTYACEDRGGAIKGNHFDIYMVTKKEAFSFGRRNLIARVVE